MNLDRLIRRRPDEKAVFILRSHPLVYLGSWLLIGVMAVVPVGGYLILQAAASGLLTGSLTLPALTLLTSGYYLIVWVFFLSSFVDYYLDVYIVTDDRILNVEQRGIFSRTVSEMDLSSIQDVTSEVKGFIPFLFNYGQVYIQTAGQVERFIFEDVHQPDEVRKQLLKLVEDDRRRQGELRPQAG